jgi:outer membrane receptor protein involved in Fe transport
MARSNPSAAYLQYARNFTEPLTGHGNAQGVLPSYVARTHVDYEIGGVHGTVRFNYLPSVTDPGTTFGAPAGAPNVFRANLKPYEIPGFYTVDLIVEYRLSEGAGRFWRGVRAAVGVNNVFDRPPPFVSGAGSGVSFESNTVKSTYDVVGRFVFMEVGKRF